MSDGDDQHDDKYYEPIMINGIPSRSPAQIDDETAFKEISATMMSIEAAVDRAEKAQRKLTKQGTHPLLEHAIDKTIGELRWVRRKLNQSTYFAAKDPRKPVTEQQGLFAAECAECGQPLPDQGGAGRLRRR